MAFSLNGIILLVVTVLLHLIAFISRDYAKKNQDRIIRNELRLRYFILTGKPFEEIEKKLTTAQLTALRFAQDAELLVFLKDAQTFSLSPLEIKKQIKEWNEDHMRV